MIIQASQLNEGKWPHGPLPIGEWRVFIMVIRKWWSRTYVFMDGMYLGMIIMLQDKEIRIRFKLMRIVSARKYKLSLYIKEQEIKDLRIIKLNMEQLSELIKSFLKTVWDQKARVFLVFYN